MGSFNKTGFISQLPIEYGDECVLVLMSATEQYGSDISGVVYSHDHFEPMFIPIFGEYDDYGTIENIKKTPICDYICEFFGEPDIDSLIGKIDDNSVGRGDKINVIKNNDIFKKMTFGLEHKSVYDKMVSEYLTDIKDLPYHIRSYSGTRGLKINGTRIGDDSISVFMAQKTNQTYVDPIIEFVNKIGKEEILNFISFSDAISVLNSKYSPSNYGSQSQEHTLHYKLLTLYRNIIVKKLGEYDDNDKILEQLRTEIRDEKLIDVLK